MLRFDSDTMLLTDEPMLIRAAERNYDKFKVPTNLVESKKISRCYSAEQQADLDIKTSVNLIGDIINLSQELQTLMWHQYNIHGDFEQIRELYYDICQLDVMSGCEIDMAKKEFAITNKAELMKLKQKWQRKNDAGKVIKPYFFKHLANAKGYLNENTKAYIRHDSTMDYLMHTINKYYSPYVPDEDIPLLDIFTLREDVAKTENREQRIRVLKLIREYKEQVIALWSKVPDLEVDRVELQMSYMQTLINEVNALNMNDRTLYALIRALDKSTYQGIRSYALTLLFNMQNRAAYKLIKNSAKPISSLQEDPEGDYKLYDLTFTRKGDTVYE